jgi:hypothetical protein
MFDASTIQEQLTIALVETLETMAFLSPMPVDGEPAPPERAMLVRICYSGPTSGRIDLVAAPAVGQALATNMLGLSTDEACAMEDVARDALKELMNVLCGAVLRQTPSGGAGYEMQIPDASPFDVQGHWATFIATPGAVVLDADGSTIAVRLT